MKILMLTPYLPYPLYSGGQIRTYNLLKNLAKSHDITLFSFIRHDEEKQYTKELLKFCTHVELFKRRPAWSFINIILAGLTPYPFLVSIYYSKNVQRRIAQALAQKHFDMIHAETFYVMPNIPKTSVPTLLVEQTIEFRVYSHFVKRIFPLLRPLFSIDVAKIKFWEKFYWQRANKVVAMSQADASVMESEIPKLSVAIVPNGVDIDFFPRRKQQKKMEKRVLFVGNFKWLQNREAVENLTADIWPKIRKSYPSAILWIVGRYPPQHIKALDGKNGIVVSDGIDDIRKVYEKADVLLAPIRGPGGTRYKILEAMASELPVVTTTRGIEGLGAQDGTDVLVRGSSESLAQATVAILKDAKLSAWLAARGRQFVQKEYRWELIAKKLDSIYREVAHV